MTIRIGINGFGRIGRNIFRALGKDPLFKDIEIVAINDLTDRETLAHLLTYDLVMGRMEAEVETFSDGIVVGGKKVQVSSHRNPADIPWGDMGVDYVAECTGLFRDHETTQSHIDAGAKKIIISPPPKVM